jgi:hypothetical protein
MPRKTNQQRLDALAQLPLPEPFLSKVKKINELCREMRDEASRMGLSLDFTPDGRFVGDIGELLASLNLDVDLHSELKAAQDGVCKKSGKNVEVKLRTQANSVIRVKDVPDILIVLYMCPDSLLWGVVYRGRGDVVKDTRFAKYNNTHQRYETTMSKMLAAGEAS